MKTRKVVIFLFITVIGILLTTTGISVAWYTSQDTLRISSMNLELITDENLMISQTNEDDSFTDSIKAEDLPDVGKFIPVSSMKKDVWMDKKESFPTFFGPYERNAAKMVKPNEGSNYVEPKEGVATEGYFSKEFFLKSGEDYNAVLDTTSLNSFIKSNEEKNKERAKELAQTHLGQSEDEILEELNSIEKSLRLSILVDYKSLDGTKQKYDYKIYDPNKNGITAYGGIVDSDYSGYYDTVLDTQTNQNYEILYGEVENRDKIVYDYVEESAFKSDSTWLDSGHKSNTNRINLNQSIANGVIIHNEDSITLEENATNLDKLINNKSGVDKDKILLIPLDANVATRIVISIYLEGWDIDNVDSTMGASFDCKLTFGLVDRNIR